MRASLLLLLLVLAFAAPAAAQEEHMLHIQDFRYIPDPLAVPPGATVTIMSFPSPGQTPAQTENHTVTAVDRSLFDVREIEGDGRPYTFVAPEEPGTYPYYCIYHGTPDAGMRGTLVVDGESAAATPPPTEGAATPPPAATPPGRGDAGEESATPAAGMALLIAACAAAALLLRRR